MLSNSIMAAALIRLAFSVLEGAARLISARIPMVTPDMLDKAFGRMQIIFALAKLVAVTVVFYAAWKKRERYLRLIPEEDTGELKKLQEEYLGEGLSTLPEEAVSQLLQLWAVILIGGEAVYCVSSLIYRRLIGELSLMLLGGMRYSSFITIYNVSHGFKYLEMLTAILLGVIMTGIFLRDRVLEVVSVVIAALFLFSFGIVEMSTFMLPGRQVAVVWTSVIFHLTETAGLTILSLYLSRRYNGL